MRWCWLRRGYLRQLDWDIRKLVIVRHFQMSLYRGKTRKLTVGRRSAHANTSDFVLLRLTSSDSIWLRLTPSQIIDQTWYFDCRRQAISRNLQQPTILSMTIVLSHCWRLAARSKSYHIRVDRDFDPSLKFVTLPPCLWWELCCLYIVSNTMLCNEVAMFYSHKRDSTDETMLGNMHHGVRRWLHFTFLIL